MAFLYCLLPTLLLEVEPLEESLEFVLTPLSFFLRTEDSLTEVCYFIKKIKESTIKKHILVTTDGSDVQNVPISSSSFFMPGSFGPNYTD